MAVNRKALHRRVRKIRGSESSRSSIKDSRVSCQANRNVSATPRSQVLSGPAKLHFRSADPGGAPTWPAPPSSSIPLVAAALPATSGLLPACALGTVSPWLDYLQPSYLGKVTFVEGGYVTAAFQSRRADDEVVEANHFARGLQCSPNARMFIRRLLGIGDDWQSRQNGAKIMLALGLKIGRAS